MSLKSFLLILGSVLLTSLAQVCMKIDSRRWEEPDRLPTAAAMKSEPPAAIDPSVAMSGALADSGEKADNGATSVGDSASMQGGGHGGDEGLVTTLWHQLTSPLTLVALTSYGVSTLLWLLALRGTPLSTAYIFSGLTVVIVTFASVFALGEPMSAAKWGGLVLTLTGLSLFARG